MLTLSLDIATTASLFVASDELKTEDSKRGDAHSRFAAMDLVIIWIDRAREGTKDRENETKRERERAGGERLRKSLGANASSEALTVNTL